MKTKRFKHNGNWKKFSLSGASGYAKFVSLSRARWTFACASLKVQGLDVSQKEGFQRAYKTF